MMLQLGEGTVLDSEGTVTCREMVIIKTSLLYSPQETNMSVSIQVWVGSYSRPVAEGRAITTQCCLCEQAL